jgi:hypothetical protein
MASPRTGSGNLPIAEYGPENDCHECGGEYGGGDDQGAPVGHMRRMTGQLRGHHAREESCGEDQHHNSCVTRRVAHREGLLVEAEQPRPEDEQARVQQYARGDHSLEAAGPLDQKGRTEPE